MPCWGIQALSCRRGVEPHQQSLSKRISNMIYCISFITLLCRIKLVQFGKLNLCEHVGSSINWPLSIYLISISIPLCVFWSYFFSFYVFSDYCFDLSASCLFFLRHLFCLLLVYLFAHSLLWSLLLNVSPGSSFWATAVLTLRAGLASTMVCLPAFTSPGLLGSLQFLFSLGLNWSHPLCYHICLLF